MNTYSELMDTNLTLEVEVDYEGNKINYLLPLIEPMNIEIPVGSSLKIDSIEIKDWWITQDQHCWKFITDKPFYQWLHHITAQGWLLEPH